MQTPPGPPPPIDAAPLPYVEPKRGTERFVGRFMLGVGWNIGLPIGSVHDFTSEVSAAGFNITFQYWLHPHFSLGGALDWQTYSDDRPRTTYTVPGDDRRALTATSDNSVQNGAASLVGRGYLLDDGPLLPFAGLHLGFGWSTFQAAAADLRFYDNPTSIVLGGELGTLIQVNPHSPLFTVSARYSTQPASEFLSVTNLQAVTVTVGIMML